MLIKKVLREYVSTIVIRNRRRRRRTDVKRDNTSLPLFPNIDKIGVTAIEFGVVITRNWISSDIRLTKI